LGESKQGREHLIEHASQTSLRLGQWKYIPPSKGPKASANTGTETGNAAAGQLYNLATDLGERQNLADAQPDRVKEMDSFLEGLKQKGRSRPEGAPSLPP
jgi:arylsulfatase A-like enzyme